MIPRTLNHYNILEKLGEGGMGEVYLAEDTSLKRRVAVKVLPPRLAGRQDRLARFQREAEALAALDHPNIVTIHSVEEANGLHFLTMQLVQGKRLSELIPAQGMPLESIYEIAIPLTDALRAAHEKGITHRDLKPANVMVDTERRVKVLDFGLAKLELPAPVADASQLVTETLTREGVVLGTEPYMSPEQVEGKVLDPSSDIFSFGVMLHEMVTGERPFRGDTSARLISSILNDQPSSVDKLRVELPRELGRFILHCLDKSPRQRCRAREAKERLEELREAGASRDALAARVVRPPVEAAAGPPQEESLEGQVRRATTLLIWIGSILAVVGLLTFMGLVTSISYRVALEVPRGFVDDAAQSYLLWGVRSAIPGVYISIRYGILPAAIIWYSLRLLVWALRRWGIAGSLVARFDALREMLARTSRSKLLIWALVIGCLGLLAAILSQMRMFTTLAALASADAGPTTDLTLLSTDSWRQQYFYDETFSILVLVVGALTVRALTTRVGRSENHARSRRTLIGVIAVLIVAAGLLAMPWRLLWANSLEVVSCEQPGGGLRKAFLVVSMTEADNCGHWLYFPDNLERKRVGCTASREPNGCQRTGEYEYIFGGSHSR